MPAAIPYAPADYYRPRNRIADLILAAGQARAAGAARSGEIWGDAIARAASGIGGAIADAPRLRAESTEREAATAFRERQMAALERGEQREEAVSGALGGYGQEGFDINAAVSSLPPDAQLGARKIYQELESSRLQADESTAYVLAKGAHIAESLLETPLQDVGMELVSKYFRQHFPQQMERLEQTVKEDPSKLKPLLQHLQGQSERFRKELEARKPKTREIKTRQPGGGERIEIVEDVPGLTRESAPAPEQPLSRIEAEAAARARGTARGKPPGGDEEMTLSPEGVVLSSYGPTKKSEVRRQAMERGLPVFETAAAQGKGITLAGIVADAKELNDLLADPEVQAAVGPVAGRWAQARGTVMSLPGSVRRALQLMTSLSDTELRKRSGAAISPGEMQRILKFATDPNKPLDHNTMAVSGLLKSAARDYKALSGVDLGVANEPESDPVSEILSIFNAAGRR